MEVGLVEGLKDLHKAGELVGVEEVLLVEQLEGKTEAESEMA